MQLKSVLPAAAVFACLFSAAQGLTVRPGTFFITKSNVNLVVQNGNLINNGNGNFSAGNLYLTGKGASTITGTGVVQVSNLYVNKPASPVYLGKNISVKNNIIMQNGLLDLNNHILTLSATGSLVGETETNRITGASGGYITITANMDAPVGSNPGNLGALITSTKNLGAVTIKRGHDIQKKNGTGKSIARYYSIEPSNNKALNAIFRFSYFDNELNGLNESTLTMWTSSNGTSWTNAGVSGRNTALNFVDLAGVKSFTRFTLSSPSFSFSGTEDLYAKSIIANEISLSPNPVISTGIVRINASNTSGLTLKVCTIDGKPVLRQEAVLVKGNNQVNINLSQLSNGMYILTAEMSDGTKKNILFVKQ